MFWVFFCGSPRLRLCGSGTCEAVEAALIAYVTQLKLMMVLGSSEVIKYSVAEGLGLSCLVF